MNIYLDANVYNRFFDDPLFKYVQIDCAFIKAVLKMISDKGDTLCWSYVLDKEIEDTSSTDIREHIKTFRLIASSYIHWNPIIEKTAVELSCWSEISVIEALQLACAVYKECEYFVNCNSKMFIDTNVNSESLKRLIGDVSIISPMNLIKEKFNSIILNEVFEDYCGDIDIPSFNQNYTEENRDYLKVHENMYCNVSIEQLLAASRVHWKKSFEHILIDTVH